MLGYRGEVGKCVCCCSSWKNKICKGLSDLLLKSFLPCNISLPNYVKLLSLRINDRGIMVHGVPFG